MASFFYRVKNKNDVIEEGYIEASTISDAAIKLERKNYIVLEIKEEAVKSYDRIPNIPSSDFSKSTIFSVSEKKEFFNSFYFLYKSGCSILQVFESMYSSSKNQKIKALCSKIMNSVKKGHSLKDTMKKYSNSLGLAYSMLVVAGEESGKLENILSNIIKNITMQEKVKSDIISKLTYPVSVLLLAIFVALLFKFFIIEIFTSSAAGGRPCTMAIGIKAAIKIGFIFSLIGGGVYFLYKNKNLLSKFISFFFAFGPISNMIKNYDFCNFFSVFALAYDAGISTAEALILAKSVIKYPNVNFTLKKAADRVQQGCELTTALGATSIFTDYAISQISTGEKSGELEKTLKAVAHDYEIRMTNSLNILIKLLEPIMIGIVGLIVLYVAINGYRSYYGYIFSLL